MAKWLRLTLIGTALLAAQPACADWQYTKWGESLQQVIAHNPKTIRRTNEVERRGRTVPNLGEALATAPYVTKDFATTAYFLFDRSGLTAVDLALSGTDDAERARSLLETQYGSPAEKRILARRDCSDIQLQWIEKRKGGNRVTYSALYCPNQFLYATISYDRIRSSSDTGL